MSAAIALATASAAMAGMGVAEEPSPRRRTSRISGDDLKGPNTNGKFPNGFLPKYLKKYYFERNGTLRDKISIETPFQCTAYNEKSARKKYEKWFKAKNL